MIVETITMLVILRSTEVEQREVTASACLSIQAAVNQAHISRSGLKYYLPEDTNKPTRQIVSVLCVGVPEPQGAQS